MDYVDCLCCSFVEEDLYTAVIAEQYIVSQEYTRKDGRNWGRVYYRGRNDIIITEVEMNPEYTEDDIASEEEEWGTEF